MVDCRIGPSAPCSRPLRVVALAMLVTLVATVQTYAEEGSPPDVVGLEWQEAVRRLGAAGFAYRVRWNEAARPAGQVLGQAPLNGTGATRVVVLEVGGAAPISAVPRPPDDEEAPPAAPLPTTPTSSLTRAVDLSRLPRGRLLDRKGPALPASLGLLEAEAHKALAGWTIRVEHTVGIPDLVGRVVNQVPAPGATLARGEKVTLVVAVASMPPDARVAPPLTGRDVSEALPELARLSLVPKLMGVPSHPNLRGRVLVQRPLPSSILGRGEEVFVLVGLGAVAGPLASPPPAAPTGPTAPRPPLAAPTLISPSEGQSFPENYGSTFQWTPVAGATSYAWEIQIADGDGTFSPVGQATEAGTRHRPARMAKGAFRWRVCALRREERGPWSSWFRLYMY